ncbi:hypothetical protein BDV93DRAFT_611468 [Ceratobasidium sp. AG-I]|nr:hypothetical protein BDV93DRAFT_611468 [Ceratobasidium sp. AG-I]
MAEFSSVAGVESGQKRRDWTEGEVAINPPKKRKTRRGTTKPRQRDSDDLLDGFRRHNLTLLEQALGEGNVVILDGFDLELHIAKRCAAKMAKTLKPQAIRWSDGPRVVLDCKLRLLVFYAPRFWGAESQATMLRDLDRLVEKSPLTPDDAGHSDRRIPDISLQPSLKPGRSVYWSLYHHAPGQQYKYPLKPCSALSEHHGSDGILARKTYLGDRKLNDMKINDMVSLIYRELHAALSAAMDKLKAKTGGTGEWANSWHSIYPCMAIVEDRKTQLHADSNGSPRAAEFLTTLGDFSGGELHLPELKLTLDWGPNTACMFDGRSFQHGVLAYRGARRICLVGYLWKSSMNMLGVTLPQTVPSLLDLRAQANAAREAREEMAERSRKLSEYNHETKGHTV